MNVFLNMRTPETTESQSLNPHFDRTQTNELEHSDSWRKKKKKISGLAVETDINTESGNHTFPSCLRHCHLDPFWFFFGLDPASRTFSNSSVVINAGS